MRIRLLILLLCTVSFCRAQGDSLVRADTVPASAAMLLADSLRRAAIADSFPPLPMVLATVNMNSAVYKNHPYYRFQEPVRRRELLHVPAPGKENLFYGVIGLLLFFSLIRNGFARYLQDLFRLFFRTTLKQRQAKEQLMESPLPSLLLNLLFLVSGSLYLVLLFRQLGLGNRIPFWVLFGYGVMGIAGIYIGKWLVLKVCGWIFRLTAAADAYSFVVFTTNKMAGILLLPFLVLLSFTSGYVHSAAVSLSLLMLGGLFCYRYFLAYATVNRLMNIHFFHFILYLLAFEIIPLLLINKVLFGLLS